MFLQAEVEDFHGHDLTKPALFCLCCTVSCLGTAVYVRKGTVAKLPSQNSRRQRAFCRKVLKAGLRLLESIKF